jgi:hypothetical protein
MMKITGLLVKRLIRKTVKPGAQHIGIMLKIIKGNYGLCTRIFGF